MDFTTTVAAIGLGFMFVGLMALLACVLDEDFVGSFTNRFGLFLTLLGIVVWLGIVTHITVKNEVNTTRLIKGTLSEAEEEEAVEPEEIRI